MNNFTFYSPTYFAFGKDTEHGAGAYVRRFGGTKVLIHYGGGSVVRSGLLYRVKTSLEKPELEVGKVNTNVKGSLLMDNSESLANIIDSHKERDLKDLEKLWQGTVENNQVIEFALKKLATPESQRRIHSSLMAKTLSAI